MAKNSANNQASTTRDKAKAMREAQKKQETKVRNLIIAIVSVIVVAVIAALATVIITSNNKPSSISNGQSGAQSGELLPPSAGGPIVVSALGVGQADPNLPNLDMYFSYTCHWCAYLEVAVGEDLAKQAEAGEYNLVLHPVDTATMAYQGPATSAALIVAEQDPENFLAFHQALFVFLDEEVNQKKDGTVVQNPTASAEKVKEIARTVGVPDDVISQFGQEAAEYLQVSGQEWVSRDASGREEGSLGTPEIIFMDTVVPWGQGTPEQILSQITAKMEEISAAAPATTS